MKIKEITIKFEEYEKQNFNREEVLFCDNIRCARNPYCSIMRLQCDPYYNDKRTTLPKGGHDSNNYDKDR